jgi:L-lactate dehydrogenase complex protein LldF
VQGWAWVAARPGLYRLVSGLANRGLRLWSRRRPMIAKLPLAGGWTQGRDFPAPTGPTFMQQYKAQQRAKR